MVQNKILIRYKRHVREPLTESNARHTQKLTIRRLTLYILDINTLNKFKILTLSWVVLVELVNVEFSTLAWWISRRNDKIMKICRPTCTICFFEIILTHNFKIIDWSFFVLHVTKTARSLLYRDLWSFISPRYISSDYSKQGYNCVGRNKPQTDKS